MKKKKNKFLFQTGGTTFGKHLVQDIDLEAPCICHRKSGKKKNPKKPAKKMLRYVEKKTISTDTVQAEKSLKWLKGATTEINWAIHKCIC